MDAIERRDDLRAGIVVTGTELLSGAVTDRNGPWLAQRLGELGVQVAHVICVGDRPDDLASALRFLAGEGVRLIVTSGGLGPTDDDVTAEVVAEFAGTRLQLDEAMERRIAEIVSKIRRLATVDPVALAAANRKQAMIPKGAQPLNPTGTAPGLVLPTEAGPTIIVLPGPPAELQAMWPAALETPMVREVLRQATPYQTAQLRLASLPESEITATLRELASTVDLAALEITTCAREGELIVDIRHRGADIAVTALIEAVQRRHADQLYSIDGSSVDEQVAALLQGRRIGLAESCTGGLLAGRLTDRPGSSDYVQGGVVSYSNTAKMDLLGVPRSLLERHGAVSPEVARAMSDGARASLGADIGVGITGIAGPGGATETKPVGYVCICVTTDDGRVEEADVVLPGNRAAVRARAVYAAMHLIRRALQPA